MCGVIGYIGKDKANEHLFKGLKSLEYRGYDSCGVAIRDDNQKIEVIKDTKLIDELKTEVTLEGHIGIGHNRWATHGIVNQKNAHPHFSSEKEVYIVHNGIIENYDKLKKEFFSDHTFASDTDTEVIVKLIEYFSKTEDFIVAIRRTMEVLEGSYAVLVLNQCEDRIYFMKNKSPLLIGLGEDENFLTSDLIALNPQAKRYIYLHDYDFGYIDANDYQVLNLLKVTKPEIYVNNFKYEESGKGQFEHFMIKEIFEQSFVIKNIAKEYLKEDLVTIDSNIISEIKKADKVCFLACGTSYHATLIGKQIFEDLLAKPCDVFIASEFSYNLPILPKKTLFILVSQSGETADLKLALSAVKENKYKSLLLTNVMTSSLAHLSDYSLPLHAGPEIAVASTKAYVAQVSLLYLLAHRVNGTKSDMIKNHLFELSYAIDDVLNDAEHIKHVALELFTNRNAFFIGRGIGYYTALEAALKLKEVTYIQAEGFASGELKHGTIALIEQNTPVIAFIHESKTAMLVRSNLTETISRGAKGIVISLKDVSYHTDEFILGNVDLHLSSALMIVVAQLFTYYMALALDRNVDKPRNLAKSVTVE